MDRHPILLFAVVAACTVTLYGAFYALAHLVYALGLYAGAPA